MTGVSHRYQDLYGEWTDFNTARDESVPSVQQTVWQHTRVEASYLALTRVLRFIFYIGAPHERDTLQWIVLNTKAETFP